MTRQPNLILRATLAGLLAFATFLYAASAFLPHVAIAQRRQPAAVDETQRDVTDEQIQQWIKELGDDDFQTRERAQAALVMAGNAAYFALEALPPSDDLEMKVRVEQTLTALEDDAAEQLRKLGASVLKRDGAKHWNHLDLENPNARDQDLTPLLRLKHLEHVELNGAPLTDKSLDYCRRLAKLRDFSSYGTNISDVGLKSLARCQNLEIVSLLLPKMTNEGFATLATLPKLRRIAIFDAPIDGEALVHLRRLKDQIEVLQLEGTLVSDDDLLHLRDFKSLRALRLSRTRVTGAGLRHIADLPELESLLMRRLELSDVAFGHIKRMRKLQRLSLNDSSVTPENLLLLRESRSLVYIRVSPEEFTEQEVHAIQKRFDERDIAVETKIKR